ncbi:biopolymer transporter ExbD [Salinisphaera sp. USBA-960]|uniref:ExbD/TolR family protein n=1 Tax=Salinisphaera orenii TaxID=856731 RepID=UPI000DBE0FCD|nr:biopolymer transporter ExbD [Salifodinibacter halophilus]NNC25626.1 biopolymer transporter ExbD [Salifodinibacter halophilus]
MEIAAPRRRRHAISLTPLIDVVFILLVFFMLATSFAHWRTVSVATGHTSSKQADHPPAVVHVAPDGSLRYKDKVYAPDKLASTLKADRRHNEIAAVIVQPAADTPLKLSVQTLDRLADSGVKSLSLAGGASE